MPYFILPSLSGKEYYIVIANPLRVKQSRKLECVRLCSHSDFYCGVNVPDETGKMSQSDKRGATLPKVATLLLFGD